MPGDDWMLIGRAGGSFGLKGEIKVEPLTDFPERFGSLDRIYLGQEHREWRVERSRRNKNQVLLKLEGIDTPEQVRELAHQDVFVPRSQAWSLPEGHFYLDDLIGIEAHGTSGERIGTVADVLRTGSNDVLVIRDGQKETLVPVIKDAIGSLDLERRIVTVEPWVLGEE